MAHKFNCFRLSRGAITLTITRRTPVRVSFLLQEADGQIGTNPLPPRKSSITRIASDWFRRFVEPPIIDHASGIYSAQRPPFFAAGKRDEF